MNQMERYFKKVRIPSDDGCWEWIGCITGKGYGQFRRIKSHRWSYQWFYNMTIPSNVVADHICRNRICIRPDHIRLVSPRENVLVNSNGFAAKNAIKTHCPSMHEYCGSNLYVTPKGDRRCLKCKSEAQKRWKKKKRSRWMEE